MKAAEFCGALKRQGFNFYTGVPCSYFKDIINLLQTDSEIRYVSATGEDEAIGIAVGAYLAGHRPVVLMQNSGLGNSMGALATLPLLYMVPLFLVVSWRGYRGKDAPEHAIIGKCTRSLLQGLGISTEILTEKDMGGKMKGIVEVMRRRKVPVAILIRGGVIS